MSTDQEAARRGATVVVPTLNRGGYLIDCLSDLVQQDHRPLEILVVDQSEQADPAVLSLVEAHPDLITFRQVRFRGLPEARNFGWQNARYDALVYVDDDIRCGPDLVSEHVRALSQPRVGIVAGGIEEPNRPMTPGAHVGRFNRWSADAVTGFSAMREGDVDHGRGCNFSTWRQVLRETGGFDEGLNVGAALYEELDFCLRAGEAGYRVFFNGRARLTHLVAPNGGCRVDQVEPYARALGHNRAVLIQRHVDWFRAPVAYARLIGLGLSYAMHYRKPRALGACVRGALTGRQQGRRRATCTTFGSEHVR